MPLNKPSDFFERKKNEENLNNEEIKIEPQKKILSPSDLLGEKEEIVVEESIEEENIENENYQRIAELEKLVGQVKEELANTPEVIDYKNDIIQISEELKRLSKTLGDIQVEQIVHKPIQVNEVAEVKYYDVPELRNYDSDIKDLYKIVAELKEKQRTLSLSENFSNEVEEDKNFTSIKELSDHYRLFVSRIQQQLSSLGGGGETQLKYLDDIVGIATNASAYDGKFIRYNHSLEKFELISVDNEQVNITGEEKIIYVAKDGDDSNDGSLTKPKLTIKSAVGIASTENIIRIAPGTYIEDNPISVPDDITIMGHSLRDTTVVPLNADQDLFYVGNGDYIAEMSFRGSLNSDKAVIAFDPVKQRYIDQSPYTQNCTNFIPNSIGLKIDGKHAIGPLKSMVVDSYTQYNQGGIGVSITNEGYAQLVSVFTICNDIAIYCGSGGQCDVTNSNSSFGTFGLVADGVTNKKYTGIVTEAISAQSDTFVLDLSTPTLNVNTATYNNTTGRATITLDSDHNFNVGMAVTISGLLFSCDSGSGSSTQEFPSGKYGYVFNVEQIPTNDSFVVDVGISTLSHTYESGGTAKVDVKRPYDGQVLFFDKLYYRVDKINITNGGSGYTEPPTITISSPEVSWGVKAQATATITGGIVTEIDIISDGRGYSLDSPPTIEFSSPQVGINTAEATIELFPDYYTVSKSTPISNGICTVTTSQNIPIDIGIGNTAFFFKQSKILATGHSFEYVGSGNDIATSLPSLGGVSILDNEVDDRNGGSVIYTSTNQSGNFSIGRGIVVDQNTGTVSGTANQKNIVSVMLPYVLSLGSI